MVAEGDQVAAYLRAFFRKRSNERIVQFDMAVFYSFRDGRIAQIREIIDSFDLVQQVLERDISALLAERTPGECSVRFAQRHDPQVSAIGIARSSHTDRCRLTGVISAPR